MDASAADFESIFNDFIRERGDEVVSDTLAHVALTPVNADYFLESRTIVAELKTLKKDSNQDKVIQEKIQAKLQEWLKLGLVRRSILPNGRVGVTDMPDDCRLEILNTIKQPIVATIKKANQQIRKTKVGFDLPNAHGLLLISNDGNFGASHEVVLNVLDRRLRDGHSSIDSFVYFAPRMMTKFDQIDTEAFLWTSGSNPYSQSPIEPEILSRLGSDWIRYYERFLGTPIRRIERKDADIIRGSHYVR